MGPSLASFQPLSSKPLKYGTSSVFFCGGGVWRKTYFSQVIYTLLQAGLSKEALGRDNLESIASYLEQHYYAQNGLLGFGVL